MPTVNQAPTTYTENPLYQRSTQTSTQRLPASCQASVHSQGSRSSSVGASAALSGISLPSHLLSHKSSNHELSSQGVSGWSVLDKNPNDMPDCAEANTDAVHFESSEATNKEEKDQTSKASDAIANRNSENEQELDDGVKRKVPDLMDELESKSKALDEKRQEILELTEIKKADLDKYVSAVKDKMIQELESKFRMFEGMESQLRRLAEDAESKHQQRSDELDAKVNAATDMVSQQADRAVRMTDGLIAKIKAASDAGITAITKVRDDFLALGTTDLVKAALPFLAEPVKSMVQKLTGQANTATLVNSIPASTSSNSPHVVELVSATKPKSKSRSRTPAMPAVRSPAQSHATVNRHVSPKAKKRKVASKTKKVKHGGRVSTGTSAVRTKPVSRVVSNDNSSFWSPSTKQLVITPCDKENSVPPSHAVTVVAVGNSNVKSPLLKRSSKVPLKPKHRSRRRFGSDKTKMTVLVDDMSFLNEY